ncbi:hypothetical protein TUBRATIS_10420 [Tubulinosema ratisbonensis]|uniref:Uncharacterized protein n=1 Tax=Tubulinosema ratisbonensis TaxID=291195 RepID=A0A437AMR2_9MICR|nr:hypothetical protein TUBRATIS_10420 [Tubulinosema ratisbonensis]
MTKLRFLIGNKFLNIYFFILLYIFYPLIINFKIFFSDFFFIFMNENTGKNTLINVNSLLKKLKNKNRIENKKCDAVKFPIQNKTKFRLFKKNKTAFSVIFIYLFPILYFISASVCFYPLKTNLELFLFAVYSGMSLPTLIFRIILCFIDFKCFLDALFCIIALMCVSWVGFLFCPYILYQLQIVTVFTFTIVFCFTVVYVLLIISLFSKYKITRLFILIFLFTHFMLDFSLFNVINSFFIVVTIFLEAIVTNFWEENLFIFDIVFYINTYVLYYVIEKQKIVEFCKFLRI